MPDLAIDLLTALPRSDGSQLVFTISGRNPVRGAHLVKRRIDKLAPPMPKWVLHDIRRTVASGMARLGINIAVEEKLPNRQDEMARSMLRDSRLDRVIPGPNSGSYVVPELRGQSV